MDVRQSVVVFLERIQFGLLAFVWCPSPPFRDCMSRAVAQGSCATDFESGHLLGVTDCVF